MVAIMTWEASVEIGGIIPGLLLYSKYYSILSTVPVASAAQSWMGVGAAWEGGYG